MKGDTILDELGTLIAQHRARFAPTDRLDLKGGLDLKGDTLVFFDDVSADLLERREQLLAQGVGGPEWFLVTARRVGIEEAKDYRELGVILVPVSDVAAARARMTRARLNAVRTHDQFLRSIAELYAAFVSASKAGGSKASAWGTAVPVADETVLLNRCFGNVENAAR